MTDYILSSNRQSTMFTGLKKNQEDISYDVPKSIVGAVKTMEKVLPNVTTISTPQANQSEAIFNIPQGGMLHNCLIQHNLTFGSSSAVNRQLGKTITHEIELLSNNKPLWRCSASALIARAADSEPAKAAVLDRVTGCLDGTTWKSAAAGTAYTTFTPVLIPFAESVRLALDTGFNEPMTLKIRYATQAAGGTSVAIATVSPVLWLYKYHLDQETYDKVRAANVKPGGLFNRLLTNTFTETFQCVGATSTTVRLNCNYPVSKLHFFVKPKTTAFVAASSAVDLINIETFQFQVAGRDVYAAGEIPSVVNQYDSAMETGKFGLSTGSSAGIRSEDFNNVITLNFGLLDNNRYMNSGLVSFINLNNPTLIVKHATLTAADYEIHVVYEYSQIVSTDSQGLSSITIAS